MKKAVSLLVCILMLAALLSVPAAAETDLSAYSVSNGTVQAACVEDVTAPCSGVLLPFDWSAGDRVDAGTPLFEMMTTRITAPEDGTVRCVFAEAGDSADAAVATYGAVLALEPARLERIRASHADAGKEEECRHLHVGQFLYFSGSGTEGKGRVVYTDGSNFEVEILNGEYDVGKTLSLYIDEERKTDSKAGSGKVYKRDDLRIPASGRIAEMLVSSGKRVKKGDTLFTLLSPDADVGTVPGIEAPEAGVLSAVAAVSGQQVWKGQLLARIACSDALEVVADVDEMDLHGLKVGDRVPVTLDTDETRILTGTVTEISGLGFTWQNAAYYTVHIALNERDLMLGQSASVYLP
ncbi:MAG: HlyD family efflux transporter periplasmic adaptor subunit [Oscillospiraceae bacterium]|nr:HlyD family efflux transporter periplasmic adaptor subunit [Oscillospiraceae bacterium]